MIPFVAFASLSLPLLSTAQLVPTGPAPGTIFKQGDPCTISWTADPSGAWKSTFIELMTGPNDPMVHLTTVATVDGTDPTKASFSFPCPAVTVNSAIYFYQFTAQGQNVTWTGRFAIANPNGGTTAPTNPTQPDTNAAIPWGAGHLADASQAKPPPPTAPAGQIDDSASTTPNGASQAPSTASGAISSSSSSSPVSSSSSIAPPPVVPSSSVPPIAPPGVATVSVAPSSDLPASSGAPAAAASAGSTSPNAATVNSLSAATVLTAAVILSLMSLC